MRSACFSVSLSAAADTDGSRAATRAHLDELEDETGWLPDLRASFAGALQYREYLYTDWDSVDSFARDCAGLRSARQALVR